MTNFKSIEELLRMLSREKALLKDMFQNRKSISYSYEMAREMVDYKSTPSCNGSYPLFTSIAAATTRKG